MKALVSSMQDNLVVQVEPDNNIFEVADTLKWVDCTNNIVAGQYTYADGQFTPYVPPAPTAEQNKAIAVSLLSATDWTSIGDVGNPQMSNPYLVNQVAFITWRSQIRAIAVNPMAGNLDWPTQPTEQWSN